MDGKIKIGIVHYNTPKLLDCLIKSIIKNVPNYYVYIFENSDKYPFKNHYENVEILDNSKGQIINFDEWLKNYPDRYKSTEATHTFGSAKHCISVEYMMDIINEGFLLMDSDILLKRDVTDIIDESCIYVGESEQQRFVDFKRLLPFVCYINVPMCRENGVHFFNEDYMHGLHKTDKNPRGDYYDTGAGFKHFADKYKHKDIKINEYITHFKGGSWDTAHAKMTPDQWIQKNYSLWHLQNKKVVYTCITGNYDTIIEPRIITPDFDYICFTDNADYKSRVWEIRPLPDEVKNMDVSNVKKQRCMKINPHKYLSDYDISIWVDGSIEIRYDLNRFLDSHCTTKDISVFIPQHPSRNCIYVEADVCKRIGKDKPDVIDKQVNRYAKEGFPKNFGLVQSNIIMRKHNEPDCIKLMDLWWTELRSKSHRDQLSFNYTLWKCGDVKIGLLPKDICYSIYFYWYAEHRKYIPIKNIVKENKTSENQKDKIVIERIEGNDRTVIINKNNISQKGILRRRIMKPKHLVKPKQVKTISTKPLYI